MGGFTSRIKIIPYDDKSFYIGETGEKNILEGEGKFVDNEGNCYIGKFLNGKFNGYGTMHYHNYSDIEDNIDIKQLYYKGQWKDNCREGLGHLEFSDGSKYIGNFHFDEIHGEGKFFYSDGSYYEGTFNVGTQSGLGKLFSPNNKLIYYGYWSNNTFHGFGKYYHDNGNIYYKGSWIHGQCQGVGMLFFKDGKKNYEAIFYQGLPTKIIKNFVKSKNYSMNQNINFNNIPSYHNSNMYINNNPPHYNQYNSYTESQDKHIQSTIQTEHSKSINI